MAQQQQQRSSNTHSTPGIIVPVSLSLEERFAALRVPQGPPGQVSGQVSTQSPQFPGRATSPTFPGVVSSSVLDTHPAQMRSQPSSPTAHQQPRTSSPSRANVLPQMPSVPTTVIGGHTVATSRAQQQVIAGGIHTSPAHVPSGAGPSSPISSKPHQVVNPKFQEWLDDSWDKDMNEWGKSLWELAVEHWIASEAKSRCTLS